MSDWRVAVLRKLGAPPTKQNLKFLAAWQRWEGGATNNNATYNWLNSTLGGAFPSINGVGVKAYPNFDVGTSYIAQTINNGRYRNIVSGLREGNPYAHPIAGDLSTWVSGSPTGNLDYARKVLGTNVKVTTREVAGSKAKPTPLPGTRQPTKQDMRQFWGKKLSIINHDMLSFVNDYLNKGEITNSSLGRISGMVDRLGSVTPPTQKQAVPTPKQKGGDPVASGVMSKILAAAHKQIGQPYVWGGESRSEGGFDCSGLIQWAYAQVGINIPRTTGDMLNKLNHKVSWNNLQPGDLIFSNGGEHVVMYVGGGKVIAAPHTGTVVQYQPLSRFKSGFVGARRIIG